MLDIIKKENIDIIVLDIMMPKMDGWEACKEIRGISEVPIIMLTAKSDERDELLGFELGVDEYITKPFSPKILMARVEAILRRTSSVSSDDLLSAGEIELDIAAHTVKVSGNLVELSYKEFELLNYFVELRIMLFYLAYIKTHHLRLWLRVCFLYLLPK